MKKESILLKNYVIEFFLRLKKLHTFGMKIAETKYFSIIFKTIHKDDVLTIKENS